MKSKSKILIIALLYAFVSCANSEEGTSEASNQRVFLNDITIEYEKTLSSAIDVAGNDSIFILYANDLHFSYPGSGYFEKALVDPITHMFQAMYNYDKALSPNLILLGGDYIQLPKISEGQTKEMGFRTLDYVNSWMGRFTSPRFMLMGNHELDYTGDLSGYGMTVDEFYSYTQRRYVDDGTVVEVGDSHQVFYMDNFKSKIRYLFLSTPSVAYSHIKTDIEKVLYTVPDGFSLIIANHYTGPDYANNTSTLYNPVKDVLKWVKDSGVDFIAWLGAHNHADMTFTQDGLVAISCLQSGAWTPGVSGDGVKYEHKNGTVTESSMTIFVIRKDLGKIYVKRFGLGRDREINYNSTSGATGEVIWSD